MSYPFLRIQRLCMLVIGNWQLNSNSELKNRLYKIYSWFVTIYFIGIVQSMPVVVRSRWDCKDLISKLLPLYITHMNIFTISLISNSANMRKVISYILDYEILTYPKERKFIQRTYDFYSKMNFKIIASFIVGPSFFAIVYYICEVGVTFWKDQYEPCAPMKGLMYHFLLPFDRKKYFYIAMILEFSELSLGITFNAYNKLIPSSMSTFQLGQIKILQEMLRHVDEEAKELHETQNIPVDEAIDQFVTKCVKKLQQILSLMQILHQATKPVMLVAFFTSTLETAVFIIRMITAKTAAEGILAVGISVILFIQILSFFWQANEVYIESQNVSNVIYNETNWIDYNVSARKKLIMMMTMCQKPLFFKALGIGNMTIETFKKIVKSCYSLVTFFKTAYG